MNLSSLKLYSEAAEKLKLDFEILDPFDKVLQIRNKLKKLTVFGNKVSFNDRVHSLISQDKFLANYFLTKAGVPNSHPSLHNIKDIELIVQDAVQKIPCVIKPNTRSLGFCVFVNLNSEEQIMKALKIMQSKLKAEEEILVENYIGGKEYRIFVFENEVIDVVERIAAYVVGDGKSSIKELIGQKNMQRAEIGIDKNIETDEKILWILQDLNYDLTTIPKDTEYIKLRNNCNFSEGGETSRITIQSVHDDNINMFLRAAKAIDLIYSGIDLIIPDITKSYKTQKCCVNEINAHPDIRINYFADFAKNNIAIEKVLKRFFNLD